MKNNIAKATVKAVKFAMATRISSWCTNSDVKHSARDADASISIKLLELSMVVPLLVT